MPPAIAAIAAWVVTAIGATGVWATVVSFAVRAFLVIGLSKLLNRNSDSSGAQSTGGGRIPVNPSPENKLPIVYGTAFVAGTVTDAKINDKQDTMWYVFAVSEVSGRAFQPWYKTTLTYDEVYWNGNKVTFDTVDPAKVMSWETNSNPPQVDNKVKDNGWIYLFNDGSSSGINTGGKTAIEILSDPEIPAELRWTATSLMSDCAFMIVKVKFNQNSGLTSMPTITTKMTNPVNNPAAVLYDYMTNTRYGCGIPADQIDEGGTWFSFLYSFGQLSDYCDEDISYYKYADPPLDPPVILSQPRYRINGPIMTGNECLTNINQILDSCDSWLKFNEITGQWAVVINRGYETTNPFTGYVTTITDLYHVTDDVLVGGIDINPTDLNSTYNAVEMQYPNTNIKDQTDYQYISLWETMPALLSPNEPFNQQTITLPLVNNAVQAIYIGARRLYTGREDVGIFLTLDYSGIQIEAGDVIRVSSDVYGWNSPVFPDGKLFRVIQVQEAQVGGGALGVQVTASEYNDFVYVDDVVQDFIPSDNTGLADPAILGTPAAPIVATSALVDGNVQTFTVAGVVPTLGQVLYFDFFYGTTAVVADHHLYRTITLASGDVTTAGSTQTITTTSFPPETYYWSVRARNNIAAKQSTASTAYVWGGPGVTTFDPGTGNGGVSLTNMGGGLAVVSYVTARSFAVSVYPTVVTPVSVLSTSTRNIPVYIPGTTVSSTKYYPYYQGTSSTADGYIANSTSPYNPADATFLNLYDGDSNWYRIIYASGLASVLTTYYMYVTLSVQLVSDADTTVQYIIGYGNSGYPGLAQFDTASMSTIELKANKPVWLNVKDVAYPSNPIVDGASVFFRNILSGTNVTFMYGYLTINKGNF